MHVGSGRSQWLISMAFFAAILLTLVIAALMINPLPTTIP